MSHITICFYLFYNFYTLVLRKIIFKGDKQIVFYIGIGQDKSFQNLKMADWEEVKRLAADFQKVQLSSSTQKLSERNCIEIVSWLLEKKIIDLIFTSDGKEYLTPQQLITDIQNELYVAGGRINIGELGKAIRVDYGHITGHLNEVLRNRKDIQHILGQLIDLTYISKIAGEINEKLQQQGSINVGELTIAYDLPAEFLQQVLEKNLGTLIFGKQDSNDPKIFFTESFIARSKAKLKGALAGITRPTPVISILSQTGLSEKLFFSLFDQTSMFGTLTSRIAGAQYIPNCYARSQNEWTTNFYKQNGYLEFDALTRLGIQDYKNYLKKQFSNEDFLFLETSVASKRILERLEAHIDECIASKSYVDLQNVLPSVFTSKNVSLIVDKLLTQQKQAQTLILEDYILSKAFVDNLALSCQELVTSNSKKLVETGKYQQYLIDLQGSNKADSRSLKGDDFEDKIDKREERRKKAAGGNKGGGTQGRETKTKSTKKHTRGGQKNVSDEVEEYSHSETKKVLQVVSCEEIKMVIMGALENEGLDTLLDPVAEYLEPKLNEQGLQIAADIFKTAVADQNANRRKTHNELQEKLNDLISEIRLFSKGIKLLPGDLQTQLNKYLLKTIATDTVTEVLNYTAQETMTNTQTDKFNQDQRLKFVNDLPETFKVHLLPLVKSLTAQTLEDFTASVDPALAACSMIIKKIDKKKDRTIVLNHKHKLLEELNVCEDVALVLHLATLIIFISVTQCMLHASGRHVSAILNYLKPFLAANQYSELMAYHDFITLMLSNGSEAENAKEKLKENKDVIKQIASEFKATPGGDKTS